MRSASSTIFSKGGDKPQKEKKATDEAVGLLQHGRTRGEEIEDVHREKAQNPSTSERPRQVHLLTRSARGAAGNSDGSDST